jgi:hypothetical protein
MFLKALAKSRKWFSSPPSWALICQLFIPASSTILGQLSNPQVHECMSALIGQASILNFERAHESIPRNRFRQPMNF